MDVVSYIYTKINAPEPKLMNKTKLQPYKLSD